MGGQLTTSETIYVSSAGVISADSAGMSSVKSYAQLLTSIAAAPLASPTFTGTPAAPTATPGTNTTQIATTAFVSAAVSGGSYLPLTGGTLTGNLLFTDNTYTIGAAGATRPSAVHVGTGGVVSAGPVTVGQSAASANGRLVVKQAGTAYNQGLSVEGVSTDSFLSLRSIGTAFLIEPSYESTGSHLPLRLRTGGADRVYVLTDGKVGIGRSPTTAFDLYNSSMCTLTVESGTSYGELSLLSASGFSTFLSSNRTLEFYVGGATRQTINASTGATAFTAPVSAGVYTFATVPTASSHAGAAIRISDRSQKWAYSDGTDWRFFVDGAVIS